MSKKKGFRTVVATVIVTLVILAALSFAAIKYIAPAYQLTQSKIYQIAVRAFPLLVGITLIAIAVVLASDDGVEEDNVQGIDEEHLNPLDGMLEQDEEETEDEAETPFVSVFESYSGSEEGQNEEPSSCPCEEQNEPQDETEGTAEVEPVQEEQVSDVVVQNEAPAEDTNKPLVDAIMTLVDKMDDFASAVIYGTQEDEEEVDDEDEEEDEDPIYEDLDRIEAQLEKLTSSISTLSENLLNHVHTIPAEMQQPVAEEVAKKEEEKNVVEDVKAVPAESNAAELENDRTGDMLFRNYEGSEASQRTKAEYDSAKEFGYDLTIAVVQQPVSITALALGDIGDYLDVSGKTLAIIPFANEDESKAELDKLEVPYDSRTYAAGSDMNYMELTKGLVE